MGEEKEKSGKKCFIITPIGSDGSEIFRKAKGVIESVIKPVLQKNGFDDIKPAYEIMDPGMIGNQIINRVVNDDLVVANITGNNPNVMYELAVRHASTKPIIHICENGTDLPFDIKDSRTIFYANDMLGVQELQSKFEMFVKNISYSKEYMDNPIYSGIKMGTIFKKMYDEGQQSEAEILQKILDKVSNLPGTNNFSLPQDITFNDINKPLEYHVDIILQCEDFERVEILKRKLPLEMAGIRKIDIGKISECQWKIALTFNPYCNYKKCIDTIRKIASELNIEIISTNFFHQ